MNHNINVIRVTVSTATVTYLRDRDRGQRNQLIPMVAVKRKRADTVQGPLKKLYTAENETDEKKSESAVSEDGQGEPNAVSSEQKNTSNKLPTAGELRAINEAANLYRSNAFKAQVCTVYYLDTITLICTPA